MGSVGPIWLLPVFVNCFIGAQLCPFAYGEPTVAFPLQQQSREIVKETLLLTSVLIYTGQAILPAQTGSQK